MLSSTACPDSSGKSRTAGKTLLQTLFFFLLAVHIGFAQWVQVGLNGESIRDVAVKNSTIFAVTYDTCYPITGDCVGKVFRSVDNGANWTMIIDSNAIDVAISPTDKIFMTQDSIPPPYYGTHLFSSIDNGDTWTQVDIIEQIKDSLPYWWTCRPLNITFSPAGIIFCHIWDDGRDGFDCIAKSTDDGVSWTTPGESIHGGLLFDFKNQSVITIGESRGVGAYGNDAYLSSDYGNTWSWLGYLETHSFHALGLFSNSNIIVGGTLFNGGPKALHISNDMGSTWTLIDTIGSQVGLSLTNGSSERMLIGTEDLGVFLFSDEGDSLGSRNEGLTNLNVQALSLDNNGYLYAGTDNGVWRRPLSEVTSVEETQREVPSSYILEQNYPNPFNPSTTFRYSIPTQSKVVIKVYDILGNEIAALLDEEKSVGTYELMWNAESLPSGVYFYQLNAGDYIDTKKMILIK